MKLVGIRYARLLVFLHADNYNLSVLHPPDAKETLFFGSDKGKWFVKFGYYFKQVVHFIRDVFIIQKLILLFEQMARKSSIIRLLSFFFLFFYQLPELILGFDIPRLFGVDSRLIFFIWHQLIWMEQLFSLCRPSKSGMLPDNFFIFNVSFVEWTKRKCAICRSTLVWTQLE